MSWAFLGWDCTYHPNYQGALCGDGETCPDGLVCRETPEGQKKCLPPLATDGEDGGPPDGDTGADDGGDAGADLPDAGDGADDGENPCAQPDHDGDGHLAMACGGDDCDDEDASSYLGATEICDGRDNDCDGLTDAEDESLRLVLCEKQHGVCAGARKIPALCVEGKWLACPENIYQVFSPRYETDEVSCDGLDNDCDGRVDADLDAPPCPLQQGVCAGALRLCLGQAGWKENCGAQEYGSSFQTQETLCDGLDNDCNGEADGMLRSCALQHLGACAVGEENCDDGVWKGCPEPSQELCDPYGVDEDCDGSVDENCGGCNDGDNRLCPLQQGVCTGAREYCQDGFWPGCDYEDYSGEKYETPPESSCDNLDNDCDGAVDGMQRSCHEQHQGICSVGFEICNGGVWQGCPGPGEETCDGLDDDCDGLLDATDGDLVRTPCELALGVCSGEHLHHPAKCVSGTWQPCDGVEYGAGFGAEICHDSLDNDCDGVADCGPSDCEGSQMDCQNQCLPGRSTCLDGAWGSCLPEVVPEETAASNCDDSLDNDCSGQTDCADGDCSGATRVCYNQCHAGRQTCSSGSWSQCDAAPIVEERERNGNCHDGIDNDCDGKTDGDEDLCCATAGITGALVMLLLWPLGLRRWLFGVLRRRENGGRLRG